MRVGKCDYSVRNHYVQRLLREHRHHYILGPHLYRNSKRLHSDSQLQHANGANLSLHCSDLLHEYPSAQVVLRDFLHGRSVLLESGNNRDDHLGANLDPLSDYGVGLPLRKRKGYGAHAGSRRILRC